MKPNDPSPWDRPRIPDGPRTVGGESADRGADEPRKSGVRLPEMSTTSGTPIPVPQPPQPAQPKPSRPVPWKWIGIVGGAVAAVAVIAAFVVPALTGSVREFDVEHAARSVVMVVAPDCGWAGSGSIVSSDGLVLTNSHVATDDGRDVCNLQVGLTDSYDAAPTDWYPAVVVTNDSDIDISVIRVLDEDGDALDFTGRDAIPLNTETPQLGDEIQTLGYPGLGGETMTFTSGDYAGLDTFGGNEFFKTTATINPGVSGGAAFNGTFALIGIPTAATWCCWSSGRWRMKSPDLRATILTSPAVTKFPALPATRSPPLSISS